MKSYDYKTEAYPLDQDGAEHEIPVRVYYDAYYDPGRVSGPPENCYPPEGELTIYEVDVLKEDLPAGMTDETVKQWCIDHLQDQAWGHFMERV